MPPSTRAATAILLILLAGLNTGCSTLGLTLYPSGERLTTESKRVLDESRIPRGAPRENAKTVLPTHVLEPGDALLIEPVNLERDLRLPADQVVQADGSLDLGPYGRLVAAGRTLEEAEALIEHQIVAHLRRQAADCNSYDGQGLAGSPLPPDCDGVAVNVRLLDTVHRFYVLGAVNSPGSYPLAGYETVLDAIVNAGGLADDANPCQILLSRPTDPCECRVTLPVCYREIVQMGSAATNYQLQPGDRVFVSSRSCIDELMFWRASRPCPRCSGCNRACSSPPIYTVKPLPPVVDAVIPPGSTGRTDLGDELLLPDDAGARDPGPTPATRGGRRYEPIPARPNQPASPADVDGELDFATPGD